MVDELSCSSKHGDATKRYRVGKKGETRSLLAGRSAGGEGELSSRRRLLTRLRAKAEESGGALVNGVVGGGVTPRVDPIHLSGQQVFALSGPFLI